MKKLKQMYRCLGDRKYRNSKTTGCPTETFGHDRRCGFTLVELVIVIAIVIILSVISVPIYRGYVDKSKMAEGYALIGAILSAQKSYYSQYGNFLYKDDSSAGGDMYTCNEEVLGIDARGNKYFTLFKVGGGDGKGRSSMKYFFNASIVKPEDLREIEDKPCLALKYNMTSGSTFIDNVAQI